MKLLQVYVLFVMSLWVESKGMWGARRRKVDSDHSQLEEKKVGREPKDSPSNFKFDKQALEQYMVQVEESLSMMEQFIKSPECTPEFIMLTMKEMMPTLFEEPGFEKSINLPDKRTLRKKLYEGVKFVRKVFRNLDNMDELGALKSPEDMMEYITNMITPELTESIKGVVTFLEPHMEAIQKQLLNSLDPENLALLQPILDAMIDIGQPDSGFTEDMNADETIALFIKNVLGGLKTPVQVSSYSITSCVALYAI